MTSDIKLDGNWVVLEGRWTRLRTWDLMLDAQDRRQSDMGWRRAMVHDQTDGLTINYNGDYPGGVTIQGHVNMESLDTKDISSQLCKADMVNTGSLHIGQFKLAYSSTTGLHIGDNSTSTRMAGNQVRVENTLTVDGDARFLSEVKVNDIAMSPKMTSETETDPDYQPYSLFERIKEMKQTIENLQERIERLERR